METKFWIGFDMGMGAIKLWGPSGGTQLVSQVATDGRDKLVDAIGLRKGRRPLHVTGNFGAFYAGPFAHEAGRPVENLDFERLTGSPEMRALLYASLAQYGQQHKLPDVVNLMVGLPLQMMVGESAADYQKAIRGWLKGCHIFEVDGTAYSIEVEEVKQTSQPVGALFDYVLDESGTVIPAHAGVLREEVGVISVGFNTLELLVVREQRALDRFTEGNTFGVRRLLELMNRDGAYSLAEMDERLRTGKLRAAVTTAQPIWAREVNGQIERVWGSSYKRFARVLVVGGGALLLQDALMTKFGHKLWIPDDAVQSIARGLWKLSEIKR